MTARSEDRGVQVEARTLSGVHLGMFITTIDIETPARLTYIEHKADRIEVDCGGESWDVLAPTDLVTLTDGGASE